MRPEVGLPLILSLAMGGRGDRGVGGVYDFLARTGASRLRGVMGGVGGRRAGWEKLLQITIDIMLDK